MLKIRVYTSDSMYRQTLANPSDTLADVLGKDRSNFAYIYYPHDHPPSIGSPLYQPPDTSKPCEYSYTLVDYNIACDGTSILVSNISLSELDPTYRQ
jgi:hypothetical protein